MRVCVLGWLLSDGVPHSHAIVCPNCSAAQAEHAHSLDDRRASDSSNSVTSPAAGHHRKKASKGALPGVDELEGELLATLTPAQRKLRKMELKYKHMVRRARGRNRVWTCAGHDTNSCGKQADAQKAATPGSSPKQMDFFADG